MANWFYLTLDTTGPANPSVLLEAGAQYAIQQLINATLGSSDADKTGYQMKLWGNVDTTYDSNIQATEVASSWITYQASKQLKLATGDGTKTIYAKLRDRVKNESAQVSDTITLDTTKPVAEIAGPDVPEVSKQTGGNVCAFSFSADSAGVEYKVKVVASTGAAHDTGVQIPTTNGSTNMSGTGVYTAGQVITCQINGADLELASSGDTQKIVKVFFKDNAGQWSV